VIERGPTIDEAAGALMAQGPRDPRLSLALALARDAGRHAVASAGKAHARWKGPGERVTDVDVAVQARMIREIMTWFPQDGVIAEEDFESAGVAREFVWVLDPLDGTNNYALGIPCFAVSVGILRSGAPGVGVIHDPNTGFTCWAVRGQGGFAGERTLAVRGEALSEASNISLRAPLDPGLEPLVLEWLQRYKLRAFGSVALHLAYAALGAIDVVLDHRAALWDIVAGAAVLLEAGGTVTDPLGHPLFPLDISSYNGGPIPFLAGSPVAHAEALEARRSRLANREARDG
jgi:myo-inositol-1(or 4)-monophosphatase